MAYDRKMPGDLARSLGRRARDQQQDRRDTSSAWRRETFTLSREDAREKAKELFSAFPKQAYMTEIESWRELADGRIEFTMRRLPTAD
ncbi:MAG: uncharacterized protein JWN07_2277 [Hyphomicrobiales bacterium]|nr:uncharacterized protein [Hyphomicrobiales bacterium]